MKDSKLLRKNENADIIDISLMEVVRYLYSHRSFLFIVTCAVASAMLLWFVFVKVSTYKSSAVIHISSSSQMDPLTRANFSNYFDDREIVNKMFLIEKMFDREEFKSVLYDEIFGVAQLTKKIQDHDRQRTVLKNFFSNVADRQASSPTADLVASYLALKKDKDSGSIVLNATTSNPTVSKVLSKFASQVLVDLNYQTLLTQATAVESFLEVQTEIIKQRLDRYEEQVAILQKREKILSLSALTDLIDKENIEGNFRTRQLKNQIAANELLLAEFRGELKNYLKHIKEGAPSYLYMAQVQKKIEMLKYQVEIYNSDRAPASENVDGELQAAIKELDRNMQKIDGKYPSSNPWEYVAALEKNITELQNKQSQLKSELQATEKSLFEHLKSFDDLPEKMQRLAEIKRNMDVTLKIYGELESKLQEVKVQKAGQINDLSIITEPEIPVAPEGLPPFQRFAIALLAGLAIGIGLLSMRYILIPTVRGREDLKRNNLTCVGEFPRYYSPQGPLLKFDEEHPLVLLEAPNSSEANSIRTTRFKVEHVLDLNHPGPEAQVLLVSSTSANEGKTYTSANLAMAMALVERKVLVIDLDLMKPNLEFYFKQRSLDEEIAALSHKDVRFYKSTVSPYLDLVRCTPTEDAEADFLQSHAFREFISQMKAQYQLIILDTPSIRLSLEPMVASQYADALLLVTNQRKTLRDDVLKASANIRENYDGPILAILNFVYDEIELKVG